MELVLGKEIEVVVTRAVAARDGGRSCIKADYVLTFQSSFIAERTHTTQEFLSL